MYCAGSVPGGAGLLHLVFSRAGGSGPLQALEDP